MGITHELDIEITVGDIVTTLKDANLDKGDSYGCFVFIAVNGKEQVSIKFILAPDWSEVKDVKPILMKVNGDTVSVRETSKSLFLITAEAQFDIQECAYVEIYSDETNYHRYPSVALDVKRGRYDIVDEAFTSIKLI